MKNPRHVIRARLALVFNSLKYIQIKPCQIYHLFYEIIILNDYSYELHHATMKTTNIIQELIFLNLSSRLIVCYIRDTSILLEALILGDKFGQRQSLGGLDGFSGLADRDEVERFRER